MSAIAHLHVDAVKLLQLLPLFINRIMPLLKFLIKVLTWFATCEQAQNTFHPSKISKTVLSRHILYSRKLETILLIR